MILLFGSPSVKAPPVIEPEPEPLVDDDELERQAKLRNELNRRRRGRRSLRVEPNPGLNTQQASSGVNTPVL